MHFSKPTKGMMAFLLCSFMALAIYQNPNTTRTNLRGNIEDPGRQLSIGDWVQDIIRPHKQHEKQSSVKYYNPKTNLKKHRHLEDLHNSKEASKPGHSDIEVFPEPVSHGHHMSKDVIIEPKLIAEDLHNKDTDKDNEQHSEMIDPKKSNIGSRKLRGADKKAALELKPLKKENKYLGRFNEHQKNIEFENGPIILP